MKFEEIMHTITAGLTGDWEKDVKYLKSKAEEFKDHEYGKEIVRACGRLLSEVLPEDKKQELAKAFVHDTMGTESILDQIRFYLFQKEFKKALDMVESLVSNIEKPKDFVFEEDKVSIYFDFKELFEKVIYIQFFDPKKEIRQATMPFSEIYTLYGVVLYEFKRFEDAKKALLKSIKWNPVNLHAQFEYMENCKQLNQLDEYFEYAKNTIKFAYKRKDIARCFRNFGWYFIEKAEYDAAIICYLQSLNYDKENKTASHELLFIQSKIKKEIEFPTEEQANKISEKLGFALSPNFELVALALELGKYHASEDKDVSKYFFNIANEIVEDEEIVALRKKMLGE